MTAKMRKNLAELSKAAAKLWIALQDEPGASEGLIMEMTGYSKRWIDKAYAELVEADLIAPPAQDNGDLPDAQQESYQKMAAMGVEKKVALDLAQRFAPEQVQASIDYVRSRGQLKNPAGYLVQRLRNRAALGEGEVIGTGAAVPQKTPAPEAVLPSESFVERQSKPDVEFQLLLHTTCAVCGVDPLLNPSILDDVDRLFRAGYRAEHVQCFVKSIWPNVWPGKTGEKPTWDGLLRFIGHTREPIQEEAARTAHQDAEEANYDAWLAANHCPKCDHRPCLCRQLAIPSRVRDMWAAMLGQLSIQLKRSTYETWLRHAQLVAFENDHVEIEVPHQYAKDWLERHLLPSMTQDFNELYRGERPVQLCIHVQARSADD